MYKKYTLWLSIHDLLKHFNDLHIFVFKHMVFVSETHLNRGIDMSREDLSDRIHLHFVEKCEEFFRVGVSLVE